MKYTEVIILCFAASILTIIALLCLVCISALLRTIFPSLRQANATRIPTSTDANADSALGYSQLPPRYPEIPRAAHSPWTQLPPHYSDTGACSPIVAPSSGPVSSRPGVCTSRNTYVPAYPRLPGLPLPAKSVPTRPCANIDRGAQHAALATPFPAVATIFILNPPRLERKDLAAVAAVLCRNVGGGRIDTPRKHMNNPAAGPMDEELMDEELMDEDPMDVDPMDVDPMDVDSMDVDLINAIDFTQVLNHIITRPKNEDGWFEEQLECTQDTHVDEEYMLGLNEMYRGPNPTQPQLVSTLSNNGAVSGVGMVPEYLARDIDEVMVDCPPEIYAEAEELIGEPMDEDILERDPAGGRATNVELQTQNLAYGIEAVQPIQAAKPLGRWDRNIRREKWKRNDISRVKAQWVKAPKGILHKVITRIKKKGERKRIGRTEIARLILQELAKLQEKNPHIFLVRWTLPRSGGGFETAETPLGEPTKQQGKYQPQVEMAPPPPNDGYETDETVEELAKQQEKYQPQMEDWAPNDGYETDGYETDETVEELAKQQEKYQPQMGDWAPNDGYETDGYETDETVEELAKQQEKYQPQMGDWAPNDGYETDGYETDETVEELAKQQEKYQPQMEDWAPNDGYETDGYETDETVEYSPEELAKHKQLREEDLHIPQPEWILSRLNNGYETDETDGPDEPVAYLPEEPTKQQGEVVLHSPRLPKRGQKTPKLPQKKTTDRAFQKAPDFNNTLYQSKENLQANMEPETLAALRRAWEDPLGHRQETWIGRHLILLA